MLCILFIRRCLSAWSVSVIFWPEGNLSCVASTSNKVSFAVISVRHHLNGSRSHRCFFFFSFSFKEACISPLPSFKANRNCTTFKNVKFLPESLEYKNKSENDFLQTSMTLKGPFVVYFFRSQVIPLLQQAHCCREKSRFLSWQLTGSSYTALPHGNNPMLLFALVSFASSIFILIAWSHCGKQCLAKCAIITRALVRYSFVAQDAILTAF